MREKGALITRAQQLDRGSPLRKELIPMGLTRVLCLASACISISRATLAEPAMPGSAPCFQIVFPPNGSFPLAPILLNTCGGTTWLLTKVPAPADDKAPSTRFVERWVPLATASGEAVFGDTSADTSHRARQASRPSEKFDVEGMKRALESAPKQVFPPDQH